MFGVLRLGGFLKNNNDKSQVTNAKVKVIQSKDLSVSK